MNGSADGEYTLLWHFGQQEHHHDTIRNRNNGRVKHICHRASHAHNGTDNHADDPHESSQNTDENEVFRIQLLFHAYVASSLCRKTKMWCG